MARHRWLRPTALALALVFAAPPAEEAAMQFGLVSPAYVPGGTIPRRYTCEGSDLSPSLEWSGAPEGTRSLALVLDDPDAPDPAAPRTTWVHWVLYDLAPAAGGVAEGASGSGLPEGAREGLNDWKSPGYRGPCPPVGRHRYFHKLFALDTTLGDLGRPTKAELLSAMEGHVLARTELVATYRKGDG